MERFESGDRNNSGQDRSEDLKKTSIGLGIAILLGLLLVIGRYALLGVGLKLSGKSWQVTGLIFVSALWGIAWMASGFLFGFLFGIPKSLQRKSASEDSESKSNQTDGTAQNGNSSEILRVNTNLEEISDWLTKVLVGATLTQVVRIPRYVSTVANFMAGNSSSDIQSSFSAALLIYFGSVGFLAGYLLTRLFFSGAFKRGDREILPSFAALAQLQSFVVSGKATDPSKSLQELTKKISQTPISANSNAELANAVAVSSLVQGNNLRAFEATDIVLQRDPKDPWALLNRARLFAQIGTDVRATVEQLQQSKASITQETSADIVETIYSELAYYQLYVDAPTGYQAAIATVEEYLSKYRPKQADLYINLACAYGQEHALLKSQGASQEEIDQARDRAIEAMKNAIDLNPAARKRLVEMVKAKPTDEDNDLTTFIDDTKVKQFLGLM